MVSFATVCVEVIEKFLEGGRVGAIPQESALASDLDQVFVFKFVEMVGEVGVGNAKLRLQLACDEPLRVRLKEELDNAEAGFCTESGEPVGEDSGLGRRIHIFQ